MISGNTKINRIYPETAEVSKEIKRIEDESSQVDSLDAGDSSPMRLLNRSPDQIPTSDRNILQIHDINDTPSKDDRKASRAHTFQKIVHQRTMLNAFSTDHKRPSGFATVKEAEDEGMNHPKKEDDDFYDDAGEKEVDNAKDGGKANDEDGEEGDNNNNDQDVKTSTTKPGSHGNQKNKQNKKKHKKKDREEIEREQEIFNFKDEPKPIKALGKAEDQSEQAKLSITPLTGAVGNIGKLGNLGNLAKKSMKMFADVTKGAGEMLAANPNNFLVTKLI